jgi:hypothetical protein
VPTESVYNFNVFHVFQSYTNGHDERYNDGSYARTPHARQSPDPHMPERKAEGSYRQAACTRQGTSTKWNAVDFFRMHCQK